MKKRRSSRKPVPQPYASLPSYWLVPLGVMSFLVAGYSSLILGDIVPDYLKAVNSHGLPPVALALGVLLSIFGAAAWWYGNIAYRCNELLRQRHFE
jgi:hypothetical protein